MTIPTTSPWEKSEGWVSITDDEGQHAYTVCIYSRQTGWTLYYLHANRLVSFLLTSNLGGVEISPRAVDLDPRVAALLIAKELER